LKDLAALDNKQLPADLAKKSDALRGVPMLLRTVSNKRLTPDQIRQVTQYIRENY
jgi:hypothetical protein